MTYDALAIVRRFDALHLDLRVFACTDGKSIGIDLPKADIRAECTVNSLQGYGETLDEALTELWQAIEDMDTGREWFRVVYSDDCKRYYRWNGAAWKEGEPSSQIGESP